MIVRVIHSKDQGIKVLRYASAIEAEVCSVNNEDGKYYTDLWTKDKTIMELPTERYGMDTFYIYNMLKDN